MSAITSTLPLSIVTCFLPFRTSHLPIKIPSISAQCVSPTLCITHLCNHNVDTFVLYLKLYGRTLSFVLAYAAGWRLLLVCSIYFWVEVLKGFNAVRSFAFSYTLSLTIWCYKALPTFKLPLLL